MSYEEWALLIGAVAAALAAIHIYVSHRTGRETVALLRRMVTGR